MKLLFSMLPFLLFFSCTSSLKPVNERSDAKDQEQQQLYLMPSSIAIDLQEINKDQPLEDSKWMVMDKIH